MTSSPKQSQTGSPSMVWDMVALLPGWILLLLIDPWIATVGGVPLGVLLVAAQQTWWANSPLTGRVAAFLLMPFILLFSAPLFVFGSTGLVLAMLLSASIVALQEGWNRRFGRSLVLRFPLGTTVTFLLMTIILGTLLFESWVTPYPTEDFLKGLSGAKTPPTWSKEAKKQAVTVVRQAALQDVTTIPDAHRLEGVLAPRMKALAALKSPHGIYVTLYDSRGYRARGFANEGIHALNDVIGAAAQAIQKRPRKSRSTRKGQRKWHNPETDIRIQIDVVGPKKNITYRPFFYLFEESFRKADSSLKKLNPLGMLFNVAFEVEVGVDGLEILQDAEEASAVMLPADPVTFGWTTPRVRSSPAKIRSMLIRTWRNRFDDEIDFQYGRFSIRKFRTMSFGSPRADADVVDWFRGNHLFGKALTRNVLIERTILAADWLSRRVEKKSNTAIDDPAEATHQAGRFHYEIYPPYKGETKAYSIVRHAGSMYGLFAIFNAAAHESAFEAAGGRALDAGLRALDYVKSNLGSPASLNASNRLCFVDKNGRVTSGATALAALSLVELPDPKDVRDAGLQSRVKAIPKKTWLHGMGTCMLDMIDSDGAVFYSLDEALKKDRVEKEPLYFPGEVMLALVRMYEQLKDDRFLKGAKQIGNRQLRIYNLALTLGWPYPGDHWIIQALSKLAKTANDPKYAKLAVLMGRGYLREQFPPQDYLFPDYKGGYRRIADLPRTTRAASRGEALGGAREAAMFLGEDASDFDSGLIEGARHLIEQQFVMENSYFIPDSYDVKGGIRMGLVDNHLRIDNNQHSIVALLNALEAMDPGAIK